MIPFERLMQDEVRQRHRKDGIARVNDRRSRGVHVQHRHLQKRHMQRHRQKAKERKIAPVRPREADTARFELSDGKRQQRRRAEQHALDRHLHGRKRAAERLERDLRGRIEHRGQQDVEIAPFPFCCHLLPPAPAFGGRSIIVCPGARKRNQNSAFSPKNAALQSRAAF